MVEGQQINSLAASGKIDDFAATDGLDYTLGDATKAYTGRVQDYDREIIFIKPYFIPDPGYNTLPQRTGLRLASPL